MRLIKENNERAITINKLLEFVRSDVTEFENVHGGERSERATIETKKIQRKNSNEIRL